MIKVRFASHPIKGRWSYGKEQYRTLEFSRGLFMLEESIKSVYAGSYFHSEYFFQHRTTGDVPHGAEKNSHARG
jgi:hypothetical protein